jgi:hypothetical protein
MRRVVTIFIIFVIAMTVLCCHKETDQDKVKKVIADIQTAGDEKDIRKIMNNLSKTYSDPQGFNYEGIKGLLVGHFFRYPKISVYINSLTISVENKSARAVFQAVLTSGEKTGSVTDVIPQSLGVWDFDVTLKKESSDWKVTSAKWEQAEMMKTGECGGIGVKSLLGSFFLVIADRCPQLLITFSDKSGMLLRQMLHINTSWTDAQCRVKLSSHSRTLGIPCFPSNFL